MTTTEAKTPEVFTPDVDDDFPMVALGESLNNVGEEGEWWVLLGHVDPSKALAAVLLASQNALGVGPEDVIGDDMRAWEDAVKDVRQVWAVFTRHPEGCECLDPEDGELPCPAMGANWHVTWREVTEATEGAVALTVWGEIGG